ncbi:acetylornithine deacetylase [Pararhodobacter sp. SW119]|uniref:acetylornithine deacetylase n=1 Tax=Pararhodobacter sp. SW119 TaxID=2780075 RepID=UPI001ADFC0B8|nr:acetylornithine deacetylase [Pararhodobacter sp. SW119]
MPSPEVLSPRAILERLVAFPTISADSNLPLIDWVADYLAGNGIASTRVPSPCGMKAHIFAQTGPAVPGGVVLSGHSDVVPVEGQAWTTDPWTLTEKDGALYGRGTCDMKGFVALSIAAMVKAAQMPLARPLQLALSYDEEVGCMAVADLVEAMVGALPRAAAVIVGEPSMMKLVTGHKGGLGYRAQVRGHAVHSSRQPHGVNAVMEGARLIDWANRCNAENAARPPSPEAAAFDPPFTTINVGRISGGTAHNITAQDCWFDLTFRVVPGEAPEDWAARANAEAARISAGMQAIQPESGITLEQVFHAPALTPEVGGPAEAMVRRLTGDNARHVVSYGTEGGQFQARGYSVVVCGPGDIAQAHQPDEFVTLAQFAAAETFLDRLLDDLCAP